LGFRNLNTTKITEASIANIAEKSEVMDFLKRALVCKIYGVPSQAVVWYKA